jgi:uncharacterized membrane protein
MIMLPPRARAPRPILLVSLALNLFLIGAGMALALRHSLSEPPPVVADSSAAPAARIERLAAMLPAADAQKLRAQFHVQEVAIDAACTAYMQSRDTVSGALRAEPFSAERLRDAMTLARARRQSLEEALQDVVATAAVGMSAEARGRLAPRGPSPNVDSPSLGNGPGG